jgi:hypothetical protein
MLDNLMTHTGDMRRAHTIARLVRAAHAELGLDPVLDVRAKARDGDPDIATEPPSAADIVLDAVRRALDAKDEDAGVMAGTKGRTREVWVNPSYLSVSLEGKLPLAVVRRWCKANWLRTGTEQHKTSAGKNRRWYVIDRKRVDPLEERV